MEKLKQKKYIALLLITILVVGIISLVSFGRPDKNAGLVKVRDVNVNSKVLSSVAETEGVTSKSYDEVDYVLSYTLDEITGLTTRDVVIRASLSDEESRYARFKKVSGPNYNSEVSESGKEIEINVNDVELGIAQRMTLKLIIENAPNGASINPSISVKEATGEYTNASINPIVVSTKSLSGTVIDEEGNLLSNIELSLYEGNMEIKRGYTDEDGKFSFTDILNGSYKVNVEEEIYEQIGNTEVLVTDESEVQIKVKRVEPYRIETHKYIEKLDLVVDGKEQHYTYDDAEKVLETIKKANEIKGEIEYKLVVKNEGEKAGTITRIEDEASEGLKLKESNTGWEEVDGKYYFRPYEGMTLKSREQVEIKLILEIESTNEAKTYLNKMTAKGEIYETVVYMINGQKYKEETVLQGEKVSRPETTIENLNGWYTDQNYTNRYNFNNPVNKDLILYAYSNEAKCNVTFIDFGTVYDEVQITCGETVSRPTDPSHTGYEFVEWQYNNRGFDFDNEINNDIELVSYYNLIDYRLRYNYNNGTLPEGVTNPTSYNIETPTFTLNNPDKPGYRFIGWTENEGDTPTITMTVTKGTTGAKTFTANYEVIPYTITYDLDGGSLAEGVTNPTEYNVETPTFTLNNPTKRGYDFAGWTGTNLTEPTKTVTVEQGTMGNLSYKATYTPKKYSIEYSGLTEEEEAALRNPEEYTIETETITLANPSNRVDGDGDLSEIFVGWTGTDLPNNTINVTIPKGSIGDREFEAHFIAADPEIYPITYDLKNGSLAEGETNPDSYTKHTDTFTLNNPSKNGYEFNGWTGTDLVAITNPVTIEKGSRGERSYEAHYTPINYRIEYNLDGGSLAEGAINPTEYNIETPTFTLYNPSKLGYRFIGWVGTDVQTPSDSVTIAQGSTGNRSYTAQYEKIKYTITYDLAGGSLAEGVSNPVEYYVDSNPITLNNPSKEAYDFVGWTGTGLSDTTHDVTIPTGSIGDRHYTAVFTPTVYHITYDLEGGSLAEGVTNPTTYTIESEDITLNNPSKTDYRFAGWTGTELQVRSKNVSIPQGSTGDREYDANYGENIFLVRFIVEGELYNTQSVRMGNTVSSPSNPGKQKNIFLYWSKENKPYNENPEQFSLSTPIVEDTTLYAIFQPIDPPIIEHTPTYWTNQNVTVTITTNFPTTYYEGSNPGVSYSGPFEVEENTTIAGVSSVNGIYSDTTVHPITNIDKVNPIIQNLSASSVTSTSFNVDVYALDDLSGIASITLYKDGDVVGTYTYPDDGINDRVDSFTLTNLEGGQTYIIKAIATDRAGNISAAVEQPFETGEPIVARIIGENGQMWQEENYINFSSLQAAIEYDDCVNTQCTIQMVTGTYESNVILNGQDITLDLNGQIVRGTIADYTIQNNGNFILIDSNENNAGILYNGTGSSLVNNDEFATITLGEDDVTVSITQPRVVGAAYGVNKASGTFNFYDGYIEGNYAIGGRVDDTPDSYSARVSSTVNAESHIKQKAILNRIEDAEARIGSTYYTRLYDAINEANSGNISESSEIELFKDTIETPGDYGFSYNGLSIVPDDEHIGESYSVIPIDLTETNSSRLVSITYKYYNIRTEDEETETDIISTYYSDYPSSLEILADSAFYSFDDLSYYSEDRRVILPEPSSLPVQLTEDDLSLHSTQITLSGGKKYNLYLKGNVEIVDISYVTNVPTELDEISELKYTDGSKIYGFDYDPETQSFRSNNNYKDGTIAFSQFEVDLTHREDHEISLTATLDTYAGRYDYALVIVSEKPTPVDYVSSQSYSALAAITGGSSYGRGPQPKAPEYEFGPYTYSKTLTGGKKYYVQMYYAKVNNNMPEEVYKNYGVKDEFVISNIVIHSKSIPNTGEYDVLTDFTSYNDDGTNMYTGTNWNDNTPYVQKSSMVYGQEIDYFLPIDLTNENYDYILTYNQYNNISSANYSYLTDNDKTLPYEYFNADKEKAIFFENNDQNYNISGQNSTNWHASSVLLEKGKKYYFHYAAKCLQSSCSSAEWGRTTLKQAGQPVFTLGRTFVNHGTEGSPNYTVVDSDEESLRFVDSQANNYVQFNNELWRIIGVFNTEDANGDVKPRIKIVRANSIGTGSWDVSHSTTSGAGTNDWTKSDLMMNLNPGYEENSIENPTILSEKYSHTANINDNGTKLSNYGDNWGNANITGTDRGDTSKAHVVSFPGAESIHVKIIYGGESNYYDWVCMWEGSHPDYTAYSNYSSSLTGKLGGGSNNVVEYDITGDTVTFSYRSDGGGYGNGYGYYAVITKNGSTEPVTSANVNNSLYWNKTNGYCYKNATTIQECNFSSNGIAEEYRDYIDEVKWDIGKKADSTPLSFAELFELEESDQWLGKVGLPNLSDIFYASGDYKPKNQGTPTRESCLNNGMADGSCITTNNWYYNMFKNATAWTIMGSTQDPPGYLIHVYPYNSSSITSSIVSSTSTYNINPVVYLDTKVYITGGSGLSKDPYTIALGNSDNEEIDNYYGLVPVEEEDEGPTIGYISADSSDYTKLRNLNSYGFDYDPETHTFTSQNFLDYGTIANTTVEIDLTDSISLKNLYIKTTGHYTYEGYIIINEDPEPIPLSIGMSSDYRPSVQNSSCSAGFNCNITSWDTVVPLQPGKKWYVHLSYINFESETYYGNSMSVQLKLDQSTYDYETLSKNIDINRNEDVDTVQILKDINANYYLTIDKEKSVILDLNGYNLRASSSGSFIRNKGEFEIIDTKADTTPGSIVTTSGNVITNANGGNVKLTTGIIESNSSNYGVQNVGTMEVGEDFTINGGTAGIYNKGTIDNLSGTITGKIGIDNYGTINDMDNVTITGTETSGITNVDKVSGATISAPNGTAINSQKVNNVEVTNTSISDSRYGIIANTITKLEDVNIDTDYIAIKSGMNDDNLVVDNVNVSNSMVSLELLSGELTIDDNFDMTYDGAIVNRGKMTIDTDKNEITKESSLYYSLVGNDAYACSNYQIANFNEMEIKQLPANNNMLISNSAYLTGSNFDARSVVTCIDGTTKPSTTTLNNVNTSLSSRDKYPHNPASTTIVNGGNIKSVTNSSINFTLNNVTVDNGDSTSNVIENNANIVINDSTVNGKISSGNNDNRIDITNSTTGEITSVGPLNISDSTVDGLVLGTTPSSSSNITYITNNLNNSTVTGNIENRKTSILNIPDSNVDTISNMGTIVLGVKETPVGQENPTTGAFINDGDLKFYDGVITSEDPNPVSGSGGIVDKAEGYDIVTDHVDDKYNMYLSNDNAVCKIGNVTYPSIMAAIDSIEDPTVETKIDVIKSHDTAEKIVNTKNVVIDLNGYTVHTYRNDFIENSGTMSVISSGEAGSMIHMNHGNTESTNQLASYSTIVNTGTFNENGILCYSLSLINENNGIANLNGGFFYKVTNANLNRYNGSFIYADYSNTRAEINGVTLVAVENHGYAHITGSAVHTVVNEKDLLLENNVVLNSFYYTSVINKNSTENIFCNNNNCPANEVWIKSGNYMSIQQDLSSVYDTYRSAIDQKIKIGSDTTTVDVLDYIYLEKGSVDMVNTSVYGAYNTSTSTVYVSGDSSIRSSIIKVDTTDRTGTSKDFTTLKTDSNTVTLSGTTIECRNSYNKSCNGVYGSVVMDNSTIDVLKKGIEGYRITMNSGSIKADTAITTTNTASIVDGIINSSSSAITCTNTTCNINIGYNSETMGNPTITSTSGGGINMSKGGTLNFANGTMTTYSTGIYGAAYSTSYPLHMNIGTIEMEGFDPNPTVETSHSAAIMFDSKNTSITRNTLDIYKGTVKSTYTIALYQYNGLVTFNLGNTNDSDVSKTNPRIETTANSSAIQMYSNTSNRFNFYDGVVIGKLNNSINATINQIEPNHSIITETVSSTLEKKYLGTPKVARIGETEFYSLNDAFEAANNGDIIELVSNITFIDSYDTINNTNKNLILDYNGYSITDKTTKDFINNSAQLELRNVNHTSKVSKIVNTGDLIFTSGSGVELVNNTGGKVTVTNGNVKLTNNGRADIQGGTISNLTNTGTTNISNGTITSMNMTSGTANMNNGSVDTLTLTNGTFNLIGGSLYNVTLNNGRLNVGEKDGVVSDTAPTISSINETGSGKLNFYDGKITNITTSVARSLFDEVEDNYYPIKESYYYLTNDRIITNITKDIPYSSVQDAIDNADNGDTLQLNKNIVPLPSELPFEIASGQNIIFDFNKKNVITYVESFTNNGTLSFITSDDFTSSDRLANLIVTNNGTLTMDDIYVNKLTINSTSNSTLSLNDINSSQANITNSGTTTITDSALSGLTLTNNGTLNASNLNTSSTYANISNTGNMTVNGGTINASLNNSNQITLSDVTLYLNYITNTGTINLTNGSISTTSNGTITNDGTISTNQTAIPYLNISNVGVISIDSAPSIGTLNITGTGTVSVSDSTPSSATIEGNTVNLTNTKANTVTINDSGSISGTTITTMYDRGTNEVAITNSSHVNNIYVNNSYITMDASIVDRFVTESEEITPRIVARNGSEIGTTENTKVHGYYNIELVDSTSTGRLVAQYVTATNSTINGEIPVNEVYNHKSCIYYSTSHTTECDYYYDYDKPTTCTFTNSNINATAACSNYEINGSTIVGDVGPYTMQHSKSSDRYPNPYEVSFVGNNFNIVDSTITGKVSGYNADITNSTINGNVSMFESVNMYSGVISAETGVGLTTSNLTLGSNDGTVDYNNPEINGETVGAEASSIYFYDGKVSGEVALTGRMSAIAPNNKTDIINVDGKQIIRLVPVGEEEAVAETDNKFYADLQAAVNDCVDGGTVKLRRDVTLDENNQVIVPEGKSIIIDLNNHQIVNDEYLIGSYTITDSTNPNLEGSVYNNYADITETANATKNIIVYQMEDGNALDSTETYKLYQLIDDQYKIVGLSEDELGTYSVSGGTEKLKTIKGKLYLNGLSTGYYKLVSNTNREIDFTVDYDSVSSNIRENGSSPSAKVTSSAVATVILTFSTGILRTPWIIVILLVLSLIVTGIIVINKKGKKQKEVI
ncbi:MAG: InlB B-repeat-containing protein [Bacilli bacterium]|nr:InlB B-repeat-containing protein [Bacilli bacterium]